MSDEQASRAGFDIAKLTIERRKRERLNRAHAEIERLTLAEQAQIAAEYEAAEPEPAAPQPEPKPHMTHLTKPKGR